MHTVSSGHGRCRTPPGAAHCGEATSRTRLAGMVSQEAYTAWSPQIDVVALDISAYSPDELDAMLALLHNKGISQVNGIPIEEFFV